MIRMATICSGIGAPEVEMHPRARDLRGLKVGRLTVLHEAGRSRDNHVVWMCQCECGKQKAISSNSLTRSVPVQSCGCMNHTRAQEKRKTSGAWNDGKSYAILSGEHCYKTRHAWAKAAIRHYGNKCEKCGWDKARCDVHHRHAKADGGLHTLSNAVVLCPNCHRIQHESELC